MKRASRVAGTRCGSYGEALATWTATGRPWRSTIAMTLDPLPRRGRTNRRAPFSERRRSRRRGLPRDRSCRGRGDLPRAIAEGDRGAPTAARAETGDYTFDTVASGTGDRLRAPRVRRIHRHALSTARVSVTAVRVGEAERSVRARPIGTRSGPCRRVRRRSLSYNLVRLRNLRPETEGAQARAGYAAAKAGWLMPLGGGARCGIAAARESSGASSSSPRPTTTSSRRSTRAPAR